MLIRIAPLDTLFFRTGRPFVRGEDTWADVIFPPFPSTLYGAIRSFMIFRRGSLDDFYKGKWKDDLGTPKSKGSLRIKGPLLFGGEVQFNVPRDLVSLKHTKNPASYRLNFSRKSELFISNYNLDRMLFWQKKDVVDEPGGYLTLINFIDYLKNRGESFSTVDYGEFFCEEPKIGIARNKTTLTVEEGYLYRIPLIRLKEGVSLVLEIDGLDDFPDKGVIQLGGEGKGAYFKEIIDPLRDLKELDFDLSNGFFKVHLATPAIFKNGWLPEWVSERDYVGEFGGIRLKLLACALGKPVGIGGWDMAENKPKPLRKAVPGGSVYYFELLDGASSEKVKKVFHFRNISDFNPEEGFGLSIIGEVRL